MVANNHALDWARRGCVLVWISSSLNSISEQSYFSVGTPRTFSLQPRIACWLWRYLQPTSSLPSACADMQNSLSHVTVELFIGNPPHIRGLVGFSSSGFPLCLIAGIKAQPNRGSQSTPKFHLRASAGKREGGGDCAPSIFRYEGPSFEGRPEPSAPTCTVGNGAKKLPRDTKLFHLAWNNYANASRKRSE